ncbi:MAG TPA: coproporphyrinogen III oxidase, partial [Pseudomonas sp.]|nr:coproporphyrinogen III oxidase [Pseudomonas sp.]
RRDVIQALICDFELSFARIEHDHAIEFRHYFAEPWPMLEQMAADGLIEISESHLIVQPAGRLLVRSICMLFDHYLPEHGNQGFSRVI